MQSPRHRTGCLLGDGRPSWLIPSSLEGGRPPIRPSVCDKGGASMCVWTFFVKYFGHVAHSTSFFAHTLSPLQSGMDSVLSLFKTHHKCYFPKECPPSSQVEVGLFGKLSHCTWAFPSQSVTYFMMIYLLGVLLDSWPPLVCKFPEDRTVYGSLLSFIHA